MKLLSLPKPKNDIFLKFNKLTSILVESGWEVSLIPSSFPNKIESQAKKLRILEDRADSITHDIIDELNKSFITPLDREDLHLLATRIDDVIDYAENAASSIVVYGIKTSREPLAEFCFTVYEASKEIAEAVRELRNLKNTDHILKHNIEINTLESKGDDLLKDGLKKLFQEEDDAKTIIKWKDIFQSFEESLDRAEDVANVIESIIIKNT
ncbi:MAG: phosphate transport regulator [Candidatus Yanofskybacteria bacterium CG10_big_fil_rev_8_21_14_0_10_36_16]|uniref:Phosphate transport regulator n=1 Tax=Candidatus Yanofskybacteria bacterium CG10_big_fil_rev_8_21_14_0_10_36_16 TaxID=1975096 RepID=A0A2J0Q730_9BACT|nr:MAG: phosphate transport regulator [Candidatus Yanofskybacteria bacterium CG10_big_fil_rev_8_21_14_0_10_36_16]